MGPALEQTVCVKKTSTMTIRPHEQAAVLSTYTFENYFVQQHLKRTNLGLMVVEGELVNWWGRSEAI